MKKPRNCFHSLHRKDGSAVMAGMKKIWEVCCSLIMKLVMLTCIDGQVMSLHDEVDEGDEDPFAKQLSALEHEQTETYVPLEADSEILRALRREEVLIVRSSTPALPTRYYRNVLVDAVPIVLCSHCNHFFHEEDYEVAVLQKGHCPFCRSAAEK